MTQCAFEWEDGWSPEHICRKVAGHPGDHRCECDEFVSQWVAEHGFEVLNESAEEARQRLRRELQEQQAKETP